MSFASRLLLAATLVTSAVASSGAAVAQIWPAKPIHLIVPFAPGATADIVVRTFGDELTKSLGQTVVVDNKAGAGGAIGTAEASHAAPDGYTLLFTSQGTMVFNMALYAHPQPRTWVELTDGEIEARAINFYNPEMYKRAVLWAQEKLKERNQ